MSKQVVLCAVPFGEARDDVRSKRARHYLIVHK